MDPIMIYRLGQIRQQEILESAARDHGREPLFRLSLMPSLWTLILRLRRSFAASEVAPEVCAETS